MNGIINVLKPPKMTSHDVVSYLRKLLNMKKIGHTGTLDPDAAGVLPICVGKGTKVAERLTSTKKKYRAELKLGVTTDTQDSSGSVLEEKQVDVSIKKINEVLDSFVGKIKQIPPMYSAVKVNGKKLYELARKGQTIERKSREVEIFDIEVINYNETEKTILFDVECSKGTYIRTLCHDVGEKLDCGGHMSFLLRTATGDFDIENSFTLDEIKALFEENNSNIFLKPVDSIFIKYPRVTVKNESLKWVQNGSKIYYKDIIEKNDFEVNLIVRVYDINECFLALYKVELEGKRVKFVPEKMFV